MLRKSYQSMVRLLSLGTISVGMLLSGASLVVPPVPTAVAQAAATTGQAASADAKDAPESNPYSDPTQCVYGAWQFAAEAGHKLPWFAGNAADWNQGAKDHGLTVLDTIGPDAVHGIAVWGPGAGGASGYGHVGWVEEVQGNRFLVKDRNWIPADDDERWVDWQEGISFIILEKPQPATPPADEPATQDPAPATAAPDPAPAPPAPDPAPTPPAPDSVPAPTAPAMIAAMDVVDPAQFVTAGEAHLAQPWAPGEALTGPWAGLPLMGVAGQQPGLPVAQP